MGGYRLESHFAKDWIASRGLVSGFFDDDPDAHRKFRSYMYRLVHARRVPELVCVYRRYVEPGGRLVAYLELAPEGDEVRRVERFEDGTVGWANGKGGQNSTKLMIIGPSDPRSPNLTSGESISRAEFEAEWWHALEATP